MRKSGGYVLLIFLALAVVGVFTFSYITFFEGDVRVMLAPPTVHVPESCAPAEIIQVWADIFEESSSGLTIVTNSSRTDTCEYFYAWKKKGNETFMMWGLSDKNGSTGVTISGVENILDYNGTLVFYSWANNTDDVNETSLEKTPAEVGDMFSFMFSIVLYPGIATMYAINWTETVDPEAVFSEKFEYEVENPFILEDVFGYFVSTNGGSTSSNVVGTNLTRIDNHTMQGYVHKNNQTTWYVDSQIVAITCVPDYSDPAWGDCNGTVQNRTRIDLKNCWPDKFEEQPCGSACQPNWTMVNNSACDPESESREIWFRDANGCEDPGDPPNNITEYCDANGNGIIGGVGDINDVQLDIDIVYIDGEEINYSRNYTKDGEEEVELVEDDDGDEIVRVRFDFEFDERALVFPNIRIEKQDDDDDFGYLIVHGLEHVNDKEFMVDIIDDFGAVCVKDRVVDDIDDIDENCDGSGEDYLVCPGEDSGFWCDTNTSGFYAVRGLDNSGVMEMTGYDGPPPGCDPDWVAGSWGSCINGTRSRTWTDQNGCPNATGQSYQQTEACDPGDPSCDPDWQCDDWFPSDADCEPGEEQTKNCVDANGCEEDTIQTKTCPEEEGIDWLLILLIGVAVLVVVVAVVLIIIVKKKRDGESGIEEKDPIKVLTKPPAGSYGKTHYGSYGGRYGGSYGGGSYGGYRRPGGGGGYRR